MKVSPKPKKELTFIGFELTSDVACYLQQPMKLELKLACKLL
jgi:hypothetical protein